MRQERANRIGNREAVAQQSSMRMKWTEYVILDKDGLEEASYEIKEEAEAELERLNRVEGEGFYRIEQMECSDDLRR